MKYEWRKQEKDLYLPGKQPTKLAVSNQQFIMIEGAGDPNGENFSQRVEVLYSVAYAIRMMPKKGYTPPGYYEYTVYPLEGLWDLTERGRKLEYLDKSELRYSIMIRQPEFVTDEVVERAVATVRQKKPSELLDKIRFTQMADGLVVQVLHVGPFDDEPASFAKMDAYAQEHNLVRVDKTHREIYLSDPRKVDSSKLKTVLRYRVTLAD